MAKRAAVVHRRWAKLVSATWAASRSSCSKCASSSSTLLRTLKSMRISALRRRVACCCMAPRAAESQCWQAPWPPSSLNLASPISKSAPRKSCRACRASPRRKFAKYLRRRRLVHPHSSSSTRSMQSPVSVKTHSAKWSGGSLRSSSPAWMTSAPGRPRPRDHSAIARYRAMGTMIWIRKKRLSHLMWMVGTARAQCRVAAAMQ